MSELIGGMFIGLGVTTLILFVIYMIMLAFSWIVAVIRAAINKELGSGKKIGWILLSIFIPFGGMVYFVFPERNRFLKAFGWTAFIPTLMIIGYFTASKIDPSPVVIAPPQLAAAAPVVTTDPSAPPAPEPEPEYAWNKTPEEAKLMEKAKAAELKFIGEPNADSKKAAYNEAVDTYTKVIGTNLDNVEVLNSRGRLKELMIPGSGKVDYELALGAADSFLKKNPYNVEILYQRSLALKGLHRMDEAKENMEEVIKLRPSEPFYKQEMQKLIDDKPFGL